MELEHLKLITPAGPDVRQDVKDKRRRAGAGGDGVDRATDTKRGSRRAHNTLGKLEAVVTEPIEAQGTALTPERAVALQQLLHTTGCGYKASSGNAATALWQRGKLAAARAVAR